MRLSDISVGNSVSVSRYDAAYLELYTGCLDKIDVPNADLKEKAVYGLLNATSIDAAS